jgi:hypothetical protein
MKNKIIISIVFLFTLASYSQKITLGSAINKAGKQRMLIQRMTKDYMSIGAGIKVQESNSDIDEATALFNENHRDLVNFARYQETKDALNTVSELWSKFRIKMASNPDIMNAESIIVEATILTNACNVVVEKIQNLNFSATNLKLPNICGKQRMNLQKIGMLYMAKTWGVNYKYLDSDLKDAISSFESNLITLLNLKESNEEIKQSLTFQKSEWEFLKKSFENDLLKPGNIYSSTNLMTKEFDLLTTQYEKLVVDNNKLVTK